MDVKSKLTSWTFYGGLILAIAHYLESQSILPGGAGNAIVAAAQSIGGFMAILGIRKAIKPDIALPGSQ